MGISHSTVVANGDGENLIFNVIKCFSDILLCKEAVAPVKYVASDSVDVIFENEVFL